MKKLASFLLIFALVVMGISYAARPVVAPKAEGAVFKMKSAAPLSSFSESLPAVNNNTPPPVLFIEPVPELTERSDHNDDIPLTYEEQDWLLAACEEFDVPYALALGLIEKETRFQNIIGDDGASAGYMQIQQKWHWDRMEHLGVTDLMEPNGNFRVGCDFLSELHEKYGDWDLALTVYNMGHNPGYITNYAKDVMGNYNHWQELLQTYE